MPYSEGKSSKKKSHKKKETFFFFFLLDTISFKSSLKSVLVEQEESKNPNADFLATQVQLQIQNMVLVETFITKNN